MTNKDKDDYDATGARPEDEHSATRAWPGGDDDEDDEDDGDDGDDDDDKDDYDGDRGIDRR